MMSSMRFAPWVLWSCLAILVFTPILYLCVQTSALPLDELFAMLSRQTTWQRIGFSFGLVVSVVLCSWCIALPLALSLIMLPIHWRKSITLLSLLPLAIPGYILAYSLIAMGGPYGFTAQVFDIMLPNFRGFWGATFALSLYNFPYLFLTLATGLEKVGKQRFEAALTLGYGPWQSIIKVVLPCIKTGSIAGSLMIALYVLGDFGVASLMRVDTLSYAIFINWSQTEYAACLALLLCIQALFLLWIVKRLENNTHEVSSAQQTPGQWFHASWKWKALMISMSMLVLFWGFLLPICNTLYCITWPAWQSIQDLIWEASIQAIQLALIASCINTSIALWLTLWVKQKGFTWRLWIVRLGYALPPLSIALGFVFMSLQAFTWLRAGWGLILIAYTTHSLLLALGPMQSAFEQWKPQWKEAALCLGASHFRILWSITFPVLRGGIAVASALSVLAIMKELPLSKLLLPPGTRTLALEAWSFADEGLYNQAAPFALILMFLSISTAYFTLSRAWKQLA